MDENGLIIVYFIYILGGFVYNSGVIQMELS